MALEGFAKTKTGVGLGGGGSNPPTNIQPNPLPEDTMGDLVDSDSNEGLSAFKMNGRHHPNENPAPVEFRASAQNAYTQFRYTTASDVRFSIYRASQFVTETPVLTAVVNNQGYADWNSISDAIATLGPGGKQNGTAVMNALIQQPGKYVCVVYDIDTDTELVRTGFKVRARGGFNVKELYREQPRLGAANIDPTAVHSRTVWETGAGLRSHSATIARHGSRRTFKGLGKGNVTIDSRLLPSGSQQHFDASHGNGNSSTGDGGGGGGGQIPGGGGGGEGGV